MRLTFLWFRRLMFALVALCCVPALCSMPESSAVSANSAPASREIIAYIFPQDRILEPNEINARRLTRINYAFANIKNGEIIEGFPHDAENFAVLNALKHTNPALKLLVSVGGWTWSGRILRCRPHPSLACTLH